MFDWIWNNLPFALPWKKGIEKAVQNQNVYLNEASYYSWFYRFINIALSVYEWEGLPAGIDTRQMEMWLLSQGYTIFFYDEALKDDPAQRAPEGYAVLQGAVHGQLDLYNIPNDRRVFAPNGFNKELDESNSVIIFNNLLRTPEIFTYMLYAQRIAEIDRTIDVNLQNQKTPKVIRCDERQRLTWKNISMQIEGNVYTIAGDRNVDLKDIQVLDLTAPFVGVDMDLLKQRYISEAYAYAGVESVPPEKRERLVSTEVVGSMGGTESLRWSRLEARRQACDEINRLFGLNVSCRFRSGTYINGSDLEEDPIPDLEALEVD